MKFIINSKFLKRVALGCLVLGAVNYRNIGNTAENDEVNIFDGLGDEAEKNDEFDPILLKKISIPLVSEEVLNESDYKGAEQINKYIEHLNQRIDGNYIGNKGRFAIVADIVKNIDKIFQFYGEGNMKKIVLH